MEKFHLDHDIHVFCIRAKSFPAGILEAHQKLHSLVPFTMERNYFGISRPEEGGGIVYRAGMTVLTPGELAKHDLEEFIIKKGEYVSKILKNYMEDASVMEKTFKEQLAEPNIDPDGACIEWYMGLEEVRCMVRLKENAS